MYVYIHVYMHMYACVWYIHILFIDLSIYRFILARYLALNLFMYIICKSRCVF